MTHLLGLTGSIGMGKSTTAQMFRDAGVPVWDADSAVHRLYAKGGKAVAPLTDLFPHANVDGAISRAALKDIIAEDLAALAAIESVVHPLVAADRQVFLDNLTAPLAVFDIPLLFETAADNWLTSVLVVSASVKVQRARVMERPDMTDAQFKLIMSRQMTDAEKRKRADHVIKTHSLDQTRADVLALIAALTEQEQHA